ncbi:hypothetical protein H4R18_005229 [Coemansia javaensis]|uniref:F-box domain-containing protein n=1 Tax=Coemansia javaensis TaxID=2761396 RepID=A0A9W8H5N3_9FUNG|nr:hypothetical protein H4R18_005229 [Coemansia javaensis]
MLPGDILSQVLKYYTAGMEQDMKSWKRALPVLAVCRSWRAAAVHMVYSAAMIGDGYTAERFSGAVRWSVRGGAQISAGAGRTENMRTNAALISSNGHQGLVKRVIAVQGQIGDPLTAIAEMFGVISEHAPGWRNAQHLSVMLSSSDEAYAEGGYCESRQVKAAMGLGRSIARELPGVRALHAIDSVETDVSRGFFEAIVQAYSAKLTLLYWRASAVPDSRHALLGGLTSYAVHVPRGAGLPVADPGRLQSLQLADFRDDFGWDCFRADSASGKIVFARLASIELSDWSRSAGWDLGPPTPTPDGSSRPALSFPALQRLTVLDVCPGAETLGLFAAAGAARLQHVRYAGNVSGAQNLRAVGLQRLSSLAVAFENEHRDDRREFYRVTNALFQAAAGARAVLARLEHVRLALDPARIAWPGVTQVSMCDTHSALLGLDLAAALPALEHLVIRVDMAPRFASEEQVRARVVQLDKDCPHVLAPRLAVYAVRIRGWRTGGGAFRRLVLPLVRSRLPPQTRLRAIDC